MLCVVWKSIEEVAVPESVLWMLVVGVMVLAVGLAGVRREPARGRGFEKLIACGPTFVAASIAVFGVEHFALAQGMKGLVPKWLPWHLFWVYFFGTAQLAAAVSLVSRRAMKAGAWCLAGMFLLFVATISLPTLVTHPGNRMAWMLTMRDTSFGLGCLAFAGWLSGRRAAVALGRYGFAAIAGVFGAMHCLYADHAPGVPLEKMTPAWVPAPHVWAWMAGVVLAAGAICVLSGWRGRAGAAAIGAVESIVTVALYLPIFVMDTSAMKMEGINYIFDTLLFAGAALLVGAAIPARGETIAGAL